MDYLPFLGAFPKTETIPHMGNQAAPHRNAQNPEDPPALNDGTALPLTSMTRMATTVHTGI